MRWRRGASGWAKAASKVVYRLRAQTAEWVNALCRNRGFQQMRVRGAVKCRITATLFAITHNLMQQGNVGGGRGSREMSQKGRENRGQGALSSICDGQIRPGGAAI